MKHYHPTALTMRVLATAFLTLTSIGTSAQPAAPKPWADIGRPATTTEIKAWDIDVRADFKGLPPGKGSAEKGMDVWEAKCASCHGTFGESNEVFTPIVGGTTQQDIKTGRVANLARTDFPQRTSMMKLSQLSTLWDYINRAMPWNEPKSLTVEEVYAVTAFILALAEVVPDDFVLSHENIAEVQQRLPNRDGKVEYKGMWLVSGKPDVQGDACMKNCSGEAKITSILPDFARDAHGNLAEQTRDFGPYRGADTTRPALTGTVDQARGVTLARARIAPAEPAASGKSPAVLAKEANCLACHGVEQAVVGPSLVAIARRYKDDKSAPEVLAGRIRNGAQGTWGPVPMPGNTSLADAEIRSVVTWIMEGAK
jgi:cytochrome c